MLPSRMFFDDMLNDLEKENKMKCDIFEKDNKVFIDGYELINGKWKRTLKALWHKWF